MTLSAAELLTLAGALGAAGVVGFAMAVLVSMMRERQVKRRAKPAHQAVQATLQATNVELDATDKVALAAMVTSLGPGACAWTVVDVGGVRHLWLHHGRDLSHLWGNAQTTRPADLAGRAIAAHAARSPQGHHE